MRMTREKGPGNESSVDGFHEDVFISIVLIWCVIVLAKSLLGSYCHPVPPMSRIDVQGSEVSWTFGANFCLPYSFFVWSTEAY